MSMTFAAIFLAQSVTGAPPKQCAFTLAGANVWNGKTFDRRDVSVAEGRFVAAAQSPRIEAGWSYLIPPFADAHTHTIDEPVDAFQAEIHQSMVDRGVFYALNSNNILSGKKYAVTGATVDAAYTGGGLTKPGGHPRPLYEGLARMGRAGAKLEDLPGRAFHEVTTPVEARAAVARVSASGARTIKLYLLRHDRPASNGLSADAFRAAVAEARKLGLSPVVHVESAADFRLAVAQRVHGVMHMPGYFARPDKETDDWTLTAADASAARDAGVIVATTITPAFAFLEGDALAATQAAQRANLKTLRDAGVTLVAGADAYQQTVFDELRLLRATALFTSAQLIEMGSQGARLAFATRKLGRLEPGYEASFLLLYADPTTNWLASLDSLSGVRGGVMLYDKARLLPAACAGSTP